MGSSALQTILLLHAFLGCMSHSFRGFGSVHSVTSIHVVHTGTSRGKVSYCGGKLQSPVEINTDNVEEVDLPPLEFPERGMEIEDVSLTNDGYGVLAYLSKYPRPSIRGGPLEGEYIYEKFNFHWGANDTVGSEHVIDGTRYSMELHSLYYRKEYGSFERAKYVPGGLVAVAFFLEAGDENNPAFEDLSSNVTRIIEPNFEYTMGRIDAAKWFSPTEQQYGYYAYYGSLTSEPCQESVIWILFPTPISVGHSQVEPFRHVLSNSGEEIQQNFREIQPLNNRKIYFATESSSS